MWSPSRRPQYTASPSMRLYAFLLLTAAALHARAASIPDLSAEKKLVDVVPDSLDKAPEVSSSEQELLDQANTIKDVDNKLRTKPEVIPVEVIVEDAQAALKTSENAEDSEEIDRPTPDLRNPGPPQRQEHETQNPEYYVAEQETILNFKKSVSDAQIYLKQGLQGITDGIQKVLENNEPLQTIQQSIKSLREGFTDQLSKINGTVQNYLNSENANVNKPGIEQTKANFHQIEKGLNVFKNEFNNRVKTLADGVEVVASLKAENEKPSESNPPAPAPAPAPAPPAATGGQNPVAQYIQSLQNTFGNALNNVNQVLSNFTQTANWPNPFAQPSTTTALPAGAQADTAITAPNQPSGPANIFQSLQNQFSSFFQPSQTNNQNIAIFPTPAPGQFGSGSGPFVQAFQNAQQNIANLFQFRPLTPPAATSAPAISSTAQPQTQAPVASSAAQADAVTPAGPVRQLILNNPISQGIAGAVQKVQNLNNPEKPREVERVEEEKAAVVAQAEPENALDRGHGAGPNTVAAWGVFVSTLVGTIGALINGTAATVSTAVNSAINTVGTNVQGVVTTLTGAG
ncbi:unnamed protein product [Chrysodeixis includens]|uniref:Uncharacterized protein n=1 Tax=Chrysodeixis includens TaxID=689277 RepID=A0A9P0C0T0_CHRIL|nr:unnamed protein product [Chrysodeixis includens]